MPQTERRAQINTRGSECDMQKNVIMSVDHLSKDFVIRGKKLGEKNKLLHALSDVSFDIYEVETLGIIGYKSCSSNR